MSIDRAAVHRPLNAQYFRKPEAFQGETVREKLSRQSFEVQRAYDLQQLDALGVTLK